MSWDRFCNDAKEFAGRAAEKINQTADLAALQIKLSAAERRLTEAYADLGKAAYLHFSAQEENADMTPVTDAVARVDAAQGVVEEIKTAIEPLRKNKKA